MNVGRIEGLQIVHGNLFKELKLTIQFHRNIHLCSPKLNGGIPSDELFTAEKNFIPFTELFVFVVQPYTDQSGMRLNHVSFTYIRSSWQLRYAL